MGVRRCLARSLTSLAARCISQSGSVLRRLYLPLRPKARFSPGRKTPPGVSAPSAGLRPLIVSRIKCGGRTLSRPHVVVATRLSPFKVRDNQRPERTMSGAAKTFA